MILYPSDTDIKIANALMGKLLSRGNDPRLDADGLIRMGGPVTQREMEWAQANRDAFQAALVGTGRYVQGTLDRIYGINEGEKK